jgi:two-component system, cell cycle sensor histidine kinase and response regulator CckA
MSQTDTPKIVAISGGSVRERMLAIERRDWWLWVNAVLITLLLTGGIVSFGAASLHLHWPEFNSAPISDTILALVGLVLLFDIYCVFQHFQIQHVRKQLVERDDLFRLITENAADMISMVDTSGRRLYSSPSYSQIMGYPDQVLRETSIFAQVHPEDHEKVLKAFAEARSVGMSPIIEYRMSHQNGSWRTLESRASKFISDAGAEQLIIVNRDITERKHLEEQFRQSQKMEAVGRLSGGVAHDFNNLLGVIIGYGEVFQESVVLEDALRTCIDEILKAAYRASSLTRQLLAFSRQQVLDPTVLDLNAVVKDLERMLQRLIGEDIRLKTQLDPTLVHIKADQGQIEQVVMNLAVNARDAMPNGGELTLETSNFYMDETYVRRYPYPVLVGNYALLSVADNGIGMNAATKSRSFEPFFTTKAKGKGTGLGLSTVYGIVKQSGGYIDILSEPGMGATFNIFLPKVESEIAQIRRPITASTSLGGSETILLVEDEDSLRKLSRHLLELSGYTVLEAACGAEAARVSADFPRAIDLLLTDVVMPGMSGRALADQLLRQRTQLRVLFMSGYTGQTVGEHGVLAEGSFFLPKPFSRSALIRKVRSVLDDRLSVAAAGAK